ncbi:MAG: nucleic acid-binding protein [Acidobacteria bacterium]|nr:nucleic acid-binding protein [Acidobacteriota bacterium]
MIRTFLDSGVLIAAWKGSMEPGNIAFQVVGSAGRIHLTSPFVRHEVSPKAQFNRRADEYRFYQRYFKQATFCDDLKAILNLASKEAAKSGVNSMDSLHVAAAHLLRADEFITTEKPGKSIYRTALVKVVYLFQ